MEVVNLTPMTVGIIAGRVYFPGPSLTLVVKGTFDLTHGTVAEFSDEQLPPTGDEPYDSEGDLPPSLRYESDLAYFKPKADLLLVGKAHAPGGHPVGKLRVSFRVGDHQRILTVIGDRWWEGGGIGAAATQPIPFEAMELRYENAFGGVAFEANPSGKGYARVPSEWGYDVWPLPNVEDPAGPVDTPGALRFPAGFGPLDRNWQWRASKTGSYRGNDWLETRWPWLPEDFEWGHFNAAPPEMQVDGYLVGNEEIHLENLDPQYPRFSAQLPGLRVRCFLSEGAEHLDGGTSPSAPTPDPGPPARPSPPDSRFREVPMHLDTLWVDAEARKLVLVWRGVATGVSEEAQEVHHLLVRSEDLDTKPLTLDASQAELEEELAREAAEAEFPEFELSAANGEPAVDAAADLTAEEMDAEVAQSIEQANKDLATFGAPPMTFPADPAATPPPSPEAEADSQALLEAYGLQPDEDLGGPPGALSRDDVLLRIEAGESLAGLDLSGADLSEMDLTGADLNGSLLVGTTLTGTRLDRATLAEANLERADLTRASLREADLTDADLTAAVLAEADLSGSVLRETILDDADLRKSRLEGALCHDAMMPGVDLSDSHAPGAILQGADLTGANLNGVDLAGADLSEACLEGVSAIEANFSATILREMQASEGADFTRASFRDSEGAESIWTGSHLVEADLAFCNLDGADFSEADLTRAELSGADLRSARFVKACLIEARMIECNLFEASLERALLDLADLRGASLYGAEVIGARFDETRLDGANLKMTKFDPR